MAEDGTVTFPFQAGGNVGACRIPVPLMSAATSGESSNPRVSVVCIQARARAAARRNR